MVDESVEGPGVDGAVENVPFSPVNSEAGQGTPEPAENVRIQNLREEALSKTHLMAHISKNPFCQGCLRAKLNAKQACRRHITSEANAFGDIVSADHLVARDADGGGIDDEKVATYIYQTFSRVGRCSTQQVENPLTKQHNPLPIFKAIKGKSIKVMYTDTAPGLVAAVSRPRLKRDTSAPYRSIANSIAERSIRTVTEGTRTLLEQSGFPVQWWPCASRCFCHSMIIAVVDGDSAYNKCHGVAFDRFFIPYGCLVDFRPPNILLKKAAKFGTTSMPGILIGHIQHVGGKWAHDYLVCPLEDFQIENSINTCRIFRIREVIPDCSGVDSCSTGYISPLRALKDHLTRTLGPHGDSIEISFPCRGSMGKIHLSNKIPKRTIVIKHQPDSQEIEDSGSGARRRRADTTRPINFDIHTWRNSLRHNLKTSLHTFPRTLRLPPVDSRTIPLR